MNVTTETIVHTNLSLTSEDVETLQKIYSMIHNANCGAETDCEECPLNDLCNIFSHSKDEKEFVRNFIGAMESIGN